MFRRLLVSPMIRQFSTAPKRPPRRKIVEIITQEDKMTIPQYLLKRPFRSYFKIGSLTFGLCFVTNFATAIVDSDRRSVMTSGPVLFTIPLISKCFQYGLLWPAFYIKALTSPREVFMLGGGLDLMAERAGPGGRRGFWREIRKALKED